MSAYAHPHARLIHPLTPSRKLLNDLTPTQRGHARAAHLQAWHDKRQSRIGASAVSTLLGVNRYSSLTELYAQMVHGYQRSASDAAQIGLDLEPSMRAHFTKDKGINLRRVGMLAHKEHDWMHCNPDALTSDGGGLELKTTTERDYGWEWDGAPSDHALAQAQWSMLVTGLPHWWVMVRFRDTGAMHIYKVEADPRLQQIAFERAHAFYHHHYLPQIPPQVDSSAATANALAAMYPRPVDQPVQGGAAAAVIRRRMDRIDQMMDELKKQREEVTNEAKAMLGEQGTELLYQDVVVFRWRHNGNFSHAKWSKAYPEQARACTHDKPSLDTKKALSDYPETTAEFIGRRFTVTPVKDKAAQHLGLAPTDDAQRRMSEHAQAG